MDDRGQVRMVDVGGKDATDREATAEAVIHQDHVYLPELQPRVVPALVTLVLDDGERMDLICDGRYVVDFARSEGR